MKLLLFIFILFCSIKCGHIYVSDTLLDYSNLVKLKLFYYYYLKGIFGFCLILF